MIFSEFTESCSHDRNPVLEHFYRPGKIPSTPITVNLFPRPPQATTNVLLGALTEAVVQERGMASQGRLCGESGRGKVHVRRLLIPSLIA